jgi:hypothetical protein
LSDVAAKQDVVNRLSRRQFVAGAFGSVLARGDDVTGLKKFSNRYEGLGSIGTGAAPSVEVIGFHGWFSGYAGRQDLFVQYFSVSDAEIRIRAREIEIVRQYWMESFPQTASKLSWARFGPWPTADVLTPEQIRADNIAVIARQERTILPAFVYSPPQKLPTEITTYDLFLQGDKNADRLVAHVSESKGREIWSKAVPVPVVAGVPFLLQVDLGARRDGEYVLSFDGWSHAPAPSNPIVFYHRSKLA